MAKRYKKTDNGLLIPSSEGLLRRRPTTRRNLIFTPGGGPCRCGFTCEDCPVPEEVLVSLPGGWTNGSLPGSCTNCAAISAGNYTCSYEAPLDAILDFPCGWKYRMTCDTGVYLDCLVGITENINWLFVYYGAVGGAFATIWAKYLGGNCETLTGEVEVPFEQRWNSIQFCVPPATSDPAIVDFG